VIAFPADMLIGAVLPGHEGLADRSFGGCWLLSERT